MDNLDKDTLVIASGFLLFFAMLFAMNTYEATMKHECRIAAFAKGMSASDIQAVCQ